MPDKTMLTYQKKINAPADLIYRAFTSAAAFREWLCDFSTSNPVEGGRLYLAWENGYFASGHFTALEPQKTIAFSWIGKQEPAWTQVKVQIKPVDGETCHLTLTHSGLGQEEVWQNARNEITKGWEKGLANLKSTLETGLDLRITGRPLLGVYPEDMTKEKSKQLEMPISEGMFIRSVIPDYGAEAAGMQAGDVVVAVNGQHISGMKDMKMAMGDHDVGDTVAVDVYRNDQTITLSVKLQSQNVEALPDTPEQLAKELALRNTKGLDALDQALKGVTEAEASFSPGPDEWSAKEVLAHLIHVERENHIWINDLVSGQERFYDQWPGNRLFQLRATLAAYPNLNTLLAEFRRSLKETVANVAFLEHDLTRQKATYWRLGYTLIQQPKHFHEHIQQIEDAIRTARSMKTSKS